MKTSISNNTSSIASLSNSITSFGDYAWINPSSTIGFGNGTIVAAFNNDKIYAISIVSSNNKLILKVPVIPSIYDIWSIDASGKKLERLGRFKVNKPHEIIQEKNTLQTDKNILNKSFSTLTDEELYSCVEDLNGGYITISDLPWKIGDTRTIHRVNDSNGYEWWTPLTILDVASNHTNYKPSGKPLHLMVGIDTPVYRAKNKSNTNESYNRTTIRSGFVGPYNGTYGAGLSRNYMNNYQKAIWKGFTPYKVYGIGGFSNNKSYTVNEPQIFMIPTATEMIGETSLISAFPTQITTEEFNETKQIARYKDTVPDILNGKDPNASAYVNGKTIYGLVGRWLASPTASDNNGEMITKDGLYGVSYNWTDLPCLSFGFI